MGLAPRCVVYIPCFVTLFPSSSIVTRFRYLSAHTLQYRTYNTPPSRIFNTHIYTYVRPRTSPAAHGSGARAPLPPFLSLICLSCYRSVTHSGPDIALGYSYTRTSLPLTTIYLFTAWVYHYYSFGWRTLGGAVSFLWLLGGLDFVCCRTMKFNLVP